MSPQSVIPGPLSVPAIREHYLEQFPFLALLPEHISLLSPWAPDRHGRFRLDSLVPIVRRATGEVMWRQFRGLPWGKKDGAEVNRPGHMVHLAEYPLVVANHKPHRWEGRFQFGRFGRDVFSQWQFEQVEQLLWVTVGCWYEKAEEPLTVQNSASRFIERVAEVTIYRPPKESSFAELYRTTRFSDTHLTTDQLMGSHPEQRAIKAHLQQLAIKVDESIWYWGLNTFLHRSPLHKMVLIALGDQIRMRVTRFDENQARITLEASTTSLTVRTGTGRADARWEGIHGYLNDADKLVERASQFWKKTPVNQLAVVAID